MEIRNAISLIAWNSINVVWCWLNQTSNKSHSFQLNCRKTNYLFEIGRFIITVDSLNNWDNWSSMNDWGVNDWCSMNDWSMDNFSDWSWVYNMSERGIVFDHKLFFNSIQFCLNKLSFSPNFPISSNSLDIAEWMINNIFFSFESVVRTPYQIVCVLITNETKYAKLTMMSGSQRLDAHCVQRQLGRPQLVHVQHILLEQRWQRPKHKR